MQAQSTPVDSSSADRLLDAARAGDSTAVAKLFAANRPLIESYLRKRTRSLDDRDDLVQNVLLRAARNLSSFRSDCPFSQWLLRIAANELKNYYERTLGRRTESTDEFDWESFGAAQHSDELSGPYQEADERIAASQLVGIAREVCNESEFAVLMMFYQDESLEEIGRMLDMKGATVRSHFLRARSKLLAYLVTSRPDFVGGIEAIRTAEVKALEAQELNPREAEAFAKRDSKSEMFRAACLKVARHLPAPLILLAGEFLWTKI